MRKHLITGLVILMPVVLTILVIGFLFDFLTAPLVRIVEPTLNQIPILPHGIAIFISQILALVLLVLLIFFLGTLARWFIGRYVFSLADQLLYRIPFIRTVYKVSRDVIAALFSTDGKKAFKQPVMVPFPQRPVFSLGFEAGEVASECQEKISTPLVSVFMPTAPHPISGFLILVPKEDVYPLDMTNEDAFKFLVSCGMIHPEAETSDQKENNEFI